MRSWSGKIGTCPNCGAAVKNVTFCNGPGTTAGERLKGDDGKEIYFGRCTVEVGGGHVHRVCINCVCRFSEASLEKSGGPEFDLALADTKRALEAAYPDRAEFILFALLKRMESK